MHPILSSFPEKRPKAQKDGLAQGHPARICVGEPGCPHLSMARPCEGQPSLPYSRPRGAAGQIFIIHSPNTYQMSTGWVPGDRWQLSHRPFFRTSRGTGSQGEQCTLGTRTMATCASYSLPVNKDCWGDPGRDGKEALSPEPGTHTCSVSVTTIGDRHARGFGRGRRGPGGPGKYLTQSQAIPPNAPGAERQADTWHGRWDNLRTKGRWQGRWG